MVCVIALLDACVLYPAPLRDFLMRLSTEGVFQPRWSAVIHQEWIRNVLAARPDLSLARLERTRDLMLTYQPAALVIGFEKHIPELELPDPQDRHVVAAAIEGGCDAIVTFNLKDFPSKVLEPYGLVALHPDLFISQCFADYPAQVLTALKKQHRSLRSPPCSLSDLLDTLMRCGLSKTVVMLRNELG
jgi:predicted nucleic acid-binding protein